MSRPLLCFPLDYPTASEALQGAERVAPSVDVLKIGLELFIEAGPSVVRRIQSLGCALFLDLKLHDIPQTVQRAVQRAADLGVDYLTVHASGGEAMLTAAMRGASGTELTLLGVTVLTSLDDAELTRVGIEGSAVNQTLRLARLATQCGMRGFVASTHEASALRQQVLAQAPAFAAKSDAALHIVTPGIRPAGYAADDQRRVATPSDAVAAGASMLVVGRPIRDATSPEGAASSIRAEIERAYQRIAAEQGP